MASNTSLNSGFSWRNRVFGLSPMVSKAERSTSPVMLSSLSKVVCKSIENLSFFLYYYLIIKVSKLRCTTLLWPLFFSQTIVKSSFHISFYSATCWNSSPFAFHLWDFISLVYCCRFRRVPVSFVLFDLVSSWSFFTPALFLSSNGALAFFQYRRTNPGVSWVDLPKTLKAVSSVVAFKEFQFSSTTSDCWCCNPPKPCPFPSSTSVAYLYLVVSLNQTCRVVWRQFCLFFCWWRRQQWILTKHGQLNTQRLSWVLPRCHFGLPASLSHKRCQCLE